MNQKTALDEAIDGIVRSYDAPSDINNLKSAAMPNRRAVIEAFQHIKPVIYLGYYSHHAITDQNLRFALSSQVYPAYEILVEQIARAVTYEHSAGRLPALPDRAWSENVVLRFFANMPELRRILDSDLRAAYESDPAANSIEEIVFSYPAIEAITAHRVAHALYAAGVPILPRIIAEHAHGRTGIDIHPGATIGERFFIDHGTGAVIGATTEIGKNVKLYQGVTLGALSVSRTNALGIKRHPTLEDDVTVYSGATILGGDTVIGKGSVIGGNVWLVRSVPPGSKVFGRARD